MEGKGWRRRVGGEMVKEKMEKEKVGRGREEKGRRRREKNW